MIIAFDFDGTVVDSYSCMEEAFVRALEKRFRWLPGKRRLARLLTKLEMHFERPTYGRHSGRIKAPFFLRTKFSETWFVERARLTKVMDGAVDVIRTLQDEGHTVISFSAEDFIPGMKERRLKMSGLYDVFDDVIIFGGGRMTLEEAFGLVRDRYGMETLLWVDDKPWRFIGRGDEMTEYVWRYFPITARLLRDKGYVLHRIPHLHIIRDLWGVLDVVRNVSSRGSNR
ncbi:MAG: HAD family hydrolase [Thermococci archaeon]|nr:HAD family hydrolase [Thermococci archaeon]